MKIRNGFVSNSSSSSFIVFGNTFEEEHIPEKAYSSYDGKVFNLVLPNRAYTNQFGWEDTSYQSVMAKLNFAAIQAFYMKDDLPVYKAYVDRITKAVKGDFEKTHPGKELEIEIYDFESERGYDYPYIDHQSASYEGANTEIFESDDLMRNFLFNGNSYIQGGNDNYGGYYED